MTNPRIPTPPESSTGQKLRQSQADYAALDR